MFQQKQIFLHYVLNTFLYHYSAKWFLFGLWFHSSKIFWEALVIGIPFLSFKGITHAYLLQISITHNKNLNPLLNLIINCISAKSTPQTFSIKDECTLLFSYFLIIGLCNSYANSLLNIFSFLTFHQKLFYEKNYKPLKQVHVDIYHISNF